MGVKEVTDEEIGLPDILGISEDEMDIKKRIVADLLFILNRALQVIERYAQYRVNEIVAKGIKVNYSTDTRMEGKAVYMVIKLELDDDFINELVKEVQRVRKLRHKRVLWSRADDRFRYRFGDWEDQVDIKKLIVAKHAKEKIREK